VFLTISSVSFGLWQEWWLDVGVFAAALCILLGKTLGSAGPAEVAAPGPGRGL
jgi:hypothetical protein